MHDKNIYKKYKDVAAYLFFGVCTTLVNVLVYWLAAHIFFMKTVISSMIAWIAAVLFAYVTNRRWVFHSKANTVSEILAEVIKFLSVRLATGIVDWMCMYIFVDVLGLHDVFIKIISNVLVIILNFSASKLIVFKDRIL